MNPLIEALGWTLLHFLWQGALGALILWVALVLLRSASPQVRYALAGGTLLLLLTGAAITGTRQWQTAAPKPAALISEKAPDSKSRPAIPLASPASKSIETKIAEPTSETVPPLLPSSPATITKKDLQQSLRPWMPSVVSLWAAGVIFFSIRFLLSWQAIRRLRSHSSPVIDPAASATFTRLLDKLHLRRGVTLFTTTDAIVPMVVGWLKPAIIVPSTLFTRLPAWQIEAILAHELAHVRRNDYLVNILQNIVETLFFYHPAVWWISAQLRKEREHCCDDTAATLTGGALNYAKALTALEEMRGHLPKGAIAATNGSLLARIRRLLGVPAQKPASLISWPIGAALVALMAGLFITAHFVQGTEENTPHNFDNDDVERQEAREKLDIGGLWFQSIIIKDTFVKPLEKAAPWIIWEEPDENGLSLGISGISPNEEFTAGTIVPVLVYLKNVGTLPIRIPHSLNRAALRFTSSENHLSSETVQWILPNEITEIPRAYSFHFSNQNAPTEISRESSHAPMEAGTYRLEVKSDFLFKGLTLSSVESRSFLISKPISIRIVAPKKIKQVTSYLNRPISEWNEMLGSGGIKEKDREVLATLGYGKADIPIPDAAIPMLLALVKSGQGATKCRCLGTLRKLENPSDTVLDAVISALGDEKSKGNRFRAGYILGHFKKRSDYIIPRLIPLIQKSGSIEQETAALALGRIGPAAKDAIPALEAIRTGASEALMKVIDSAIQSIRDTAPEADDGAAAQSEGILIMVNDANTDAPIEEFHVLAGVPSSVSQQFETDHNTAVVNWQAHTIKIGRDGEFSWPADKGYAEMSLRIEADGYVPQIIHGLKKGDQKIFDIKLKRDAGIAGSVQTPNGKRAAHDATVVLAMIRRNARLKGSTFPELALSKGDSLRDQWERPTVVQPDEQGRFTLPNEPDPTAVVLILHGDGVFVQPFAEWKKATNVTLEPWGRIHGDVRWGGDKVGSDEMVNLSINRGDALGYPDIVAQYDETIANDKGHFVFERVLPGMAQLSCPIEFDAGDGKKYSSYLEGRITHADIKAPHTSVIIGGKGRTVTGKLTGFANLNGITFRVHPNAPHFGRPGDDRQWAAWNVFKQSPAGGSFFRDGLKVADDGTFEILAMLPGYYQIFFEQEGGKKNAANGVFRIPKEEWEGDSEPFDAGQFKAR
jgi:beta-lactamase regulating signal transducer with metallopeptidase domain